MNRVHETHSDSEYWYIKQPPATTGRAKCVETEPGLIPSDLAQEPLKSNRKHPSYVTLHKNVIFYVMKIDPPFILFDSRDTPTYTWEKIFQINHQIRKL